MKYFTEQITRKLARAFIEDWSVANRETYPFSLTNVNKALKRIDPHKKPIGAVTSEAPELLRFVDEIAWKDYKKLPPKLGAGGRLMQRGEASTNGKSPLEDIKLPPINASEKAEKVRWDQQEKDQLVEAWLEEWTAKPEIGLTIDAFLKAMHKVLHESRWRKVGGVSVIPEIYEKALDTVRSIVATGIAPPAPKVEIQTVPVPYDPVKVLDEVPLPVLAAALARREMEQRLAYYRMALPTPAAREAVKVEALPSRAQIEALLPLVQVIGFRPAQHADMVAKFRHKAVRFAPSVDPAAPLEPSRLVTKAAAYIVESDKCPAPWQKLVTDHVEFGLREKHFGASRVLDHIDTFVARWTSSHPDIVKQWAAVNNGNSSH